LSNVSFGITSLDDFCELVTYESVIDGAGNPYDGRVDGEGNPIYGGTPVLDSGGSQVHIGSNPVYSGGVALTFPTTCTPPSFTGGQVDGQLYHLRLTYRLDNGVVGVIGDYVPFNRIGKIGVPVVVRRPNTIYNYGVPSFSGGEVPAADIILTYESGNRQDRLVVGIGVNSEIISFEVLYPNPDAGGNLPYTCT
jgi:hypothetical protein